MPLYKEDRETLEVLVQKELEVDCFCGKLLKVTTQIRNSGTPFLQLCRCKNCREESEGEKWQDGWDEGYEEARAEFEK